MWTKWISLLSFPQVAKSMFGATRKKFMEGLDNDYPDDGMYFSQPSIFTQDVRRKGGKKKHSKYSKMSNLKEFNSVTIEIFILKPLISFCSVSFDLINVGVDLLRNSEIPSC